MKAAVWHGRRDIRVEEVEPTPPGPGQVTVEVAYCGICGSDLHEYVGGPIAIPTTRPHPLTGRMAPVTLGHEFAGTVSALGEGVSDLRVGERVTADACWYCGECFWCRRGEYNLCRLGGGTGLSADGGFARYVTVPAYSLYRLPDSVPLTVGALCEPISVGIHAVQRGRLEPGETAVILGAGPIGLTTLQAVKAAGAGAVYCIEPAAARQAQARALGATEVFSPDDGLVRALRRQTDGLGADVVFECVGRAETANQAIELARRGGRVVVAGVFEGTAPVDFNRIVWFEREVIGTLGYAGDFRDTIAMLADGRIKGEPLISKQIPLAEIVQGGFEELLAHRDQHIKILVQPQ